MNIFNLFHRLRKFFRRTSDHQDTIPPSGSAQDQDLQNHSSEIKGSPKVGRFSGLRERYRRFLGSAMDLGNVSIQSLQIEGKNYLFGFEWRLIPPTRALIRTLSLARKEGKSLYVISEMEDIIGVSENAPARRGPKFSAALHLASKFSQGGLELYAFEFSDSRIAVIALNESRPIPGFDFLGDVFTAKSLIDEFLAIQSGQLIRQVGNAGLLEAEESVAPEDLFASPAKAARIRTLSNGRSTRILLAAGALTGLTVISVMYGLDYERQKVIEENRRAAETPDVIYRKELAIALRQLPSSGHSRFEAWMVKLRGLPTSHAGWRLVRIECKNQECKAQWDRQYGSFSDFIRSLPSHTDRAEEIQVQDNPLKASVLTWHTVDSTSAQDHSIERAQLPNMPIGIRLVSDHFQDLSLLGNAEAKITKPLLFGSNVDPGQVAESIFSGPWMLSSELWILPYVKIPEHCVVVSLEVDFFDDKGDPHPIFKVKGDYYVRPEKNH